MKELKPLRGEGDRQTSDASDIAAGPVHAGDKAVQDWVSPCLKNDRYDGGCGLSCEAWCGSGARGNDGDWIANEISRQRWQPIVLAVCPPIFDCNVTTFNKAGFVQALAKVRNVLRNRLA